MDNTQERTMRTESWVVASLAEASRLSEGELVEVMTRLPHGMTLSEVRIIGNLAYNLPHTEGVFGSSQEALERSAVYNLGKTALEFDGDIATARSAAEYLRGRHSSFLNGFRARGLERKVKRATGRQAVSRAPLKRA